MSQIKLPFIITLFLLFAPISINCIITKEHDDSDDECNIIKGMFVFGSSLVDNGNNNYLQNSMARADYSPYGIDFPVGISGRFTNGRNVIDLLSQKLNLPYFIPSFNDPSTNGIRIINGVNFASGGSGILNDTGAVAGNVTSLNVQIRNFEKVTLPELELQLGRKNRETLLSQYLFVVGSGGNDYSFNYFLGLANYNSVEAFTSNLITTLSNQLQSLYNLGARKFVLMAINPNGCSPSATARLPKTNNGCVEHLNQAAQLFNVNLKNLVDDIRPKMPGSNLVFVNSYNVMIDILRSPTSGGFDDTSSSCCEVGGTGLLCRRGGSVCENRNTYVYFDGLHPTEAVNVVIASKAFESVLTTEVYPFSVKKLSEI